MASDVEQPTDEQAAEWKRMIRETIAKLLPGARTGPDPWLGYLLGRSPLTAVSLGAAAFQPSGEVGTRAPVALVQGLRGRRDRRFRSVDLGSTSH